MTKIISVIKCFGVFSIVTACAYIESRVAAARTISLERRRADLTATLVRAQGGASPAEFARSMSRRQTIQRRQLSQLPGIDCHPQRRPNCVIRLDIRHEAEPCFLTSVSWRIPETSDCWTRGLSGDVAGRPVGQLADQACAELVDATGLLAGLAFHQVRSGSRAAALAEQLDTPYAKSARVLAGTPAAGSEFSQRAARSAPANSPEPTLAPMEILFAELAARRLRSLVSRERP
jgi:hypothetical protein